MRQEEIEKIIFTKEQERDSLEKEIRKRDRRIIELQAEIRVYQRLKQENENGRRA